MLPIALRALLIGAMDNALRSEQTIASDGGGGSESRSPLPLTDCRSTADDGGDGSRSRMYSWRQHQGVLLVSAGQVSDQRERSH